MDVSSVTSPIGLWTAVLKPQVCILAALLFLYLSANASASLVSKVHPKLLLTVGLRPNYQNYETTRMASAVILTVHMLVAYHFNNQYINQSIK